MCLLQTCNKVTRFATDTCITIFNLNAKIPFKKVNQIYNIDITCLFCYKPVTKIYKIRKNK